MVPDLKVIDFVPAAEDEVAWELKIEMTQLQDEIDRRYEKMEHHCHIIEALNESLEAANETLTNYLRGK